MAHITLSIPDSVYRRVKRHSEVKWSEIARRSIVEHLEQVEGVTTTAEIRRMLPPETLRSMREASKAEAKVFRKGVREAEWKRTRSLTRTS